MSENARGDDHRLRRELQRLPRIRASKNFTRQVLTRARQSERRPPSRGWRTLPRLATACAILAALVTGGLVLEQQLDRRAYERRRAALERRHGELLRELAEIREQATRPARLYVGSAPDVDLVVDLDPWMEPTSGVRPATYRTQP